MQTDRAIRLDPKTGATVEYLMPTDTNMRSVFVDDSTTPVTFWTGSNHAHALVKVEPLDYRRATPGLPRPRAGHAMAKAACRRFAPPFSPPSAGTPQRINRTGNPSRLAPR